MALERFDDGNHAIMATNPEVVALGDIMGKYNS
jgi:hypothetical protein